MQNRPVPLPPVLIEAFPPASELLLDRARRLVDDAMLVDIAEADYGELADEMLVALRPIRDQGILPSLWPWQLGEVLELTRWSDLGKPNASPFEPGPTARRGHATRLFACAVLLRAAAEPACRYNDISDDSTLALSLSSAQVVGREMEEALACFFTWKLLHIKHLHEGIYLSLALLVLAARLSPIPVTDQVLGSLAEMVLEQESNYRCLLNWNCEDPMPIDFGIQRGFWRTITSELKELAESISIEEIRTNLKLCTLILESH